MEEKKNGIKIKDWNNRFDNKLKSLKNANLKIELLKSDIIENQRILNEYKFDEQNKKRKKTTKGNMLLNKNSEIRLIQRSNINNYQELDHDNYFLKKILEKIKERKENIKKGKPLVFKRYKTNNDYGNLKYNFYTDKHITSSDKNIIHNNNFKNNIKEEKPLMIKHKTNLILNLNLEQNKNEEYSVKDIINLNYNKNNTENNVNCFFETLSHPDKYELKSSSSNKNNRIKNMIKMIKVVRNGLQNCELSGNLLNNKIQKTKNNLRFNNSETKNKDKRKLILKINYSKIKDVRDIRRQIFSNPKENIKNDKSSSKHKKNNKDKKDINKKKLILPLCTPNNKSNISYIKTNFNNI